MHLFAPFHHILALVSYISTPSGATFGGHPRVWRPSTRYPDEISSYYGGFSSNGRSQPIGGPVGGSFRGRGAVAPRGAGSALPIGSSSRSCSSAYSGPIGSSATSFSRESSLSEHDNGSVSRCPPAPTRDVWVKKDVGRNVPDIPAEPLADAVSSPEPELLPKPAGPPEDSAPSEPGKPEHKPRMSVAARKQMKKDSRRDSKPDPSPPPSQSSPEKKPPLLPITTHVENFGMMQNEQSPLFPIMNGNLYMTPPSREKSSRSIGEGTSSNPSFYSAMSSLSVRSRVGFGNMASPVSPGVLSEQYDRSPAPLRSPSQFQDDPRALRGRRRAVSMPPPEVETSGEDVEEPRNSVISESVSKDESLRDNVVDTGTGKGTEKEKETEPKSSFGGPHSPSRSHEKTVIKGESRLEEKSVSYYPPAGGKSAKAQPKRIWKPKKSSGPSSPKEEEKETVLVEPLTESSRDWKPQLRPIVSESFRGRGWSEGDLDANGRIGVAEGVSQSFPRLSGHSVDAMNRETSVESIRSEIRRRRRSLKTPADPKVMLFECPSGHLSLPQGLLSDEQVPQPSLLPWRKLPGAAEWSLMVWNAQWLFSGKDEWIRWNRPKSLRHGSVVGGIQNLLIAESPTLVGLLEVEDCGVLANEILLPAASLRHYEAFLKFSEDTENGHNNAVLARNPMKPVAPLEISELRSPYPLPGFLEFFVDFMAVKRTLGFTDMMDVKGKGKAKGVGRGKGVFVDDSWKKFEMSKLLRSTSGDLRPGSTSLPKHSVSIHRLPGGEEVALILVHLTPTSQWVRSPARREGQALVARLLAEEQMEKGRGVIVAGDFNEMECPLKLLTDCSTVPNSRALEIVKGDREVMKQIYEDGRVEREAPELRRRSYSGLINVASKINGEDRVSHVHGALIDHVFVDKNLYRKVKSVRIVPGIMGGISDHAPLLVEFGK